MLINRFFRPVGLGLLGCLLFAGTARADKPAPTPIAAVKHDQPVDFQKEVLPILKKHCLACHNATVAESGLVLENPTRIVKGGDSGAAVVPKKSGESLLLKRATGEVDPQMPPKDNKAAAKPLSPEELGLLKVWIDQGATGTVSAGGIVDWQPLPPGVNPIYAVALTPDGQYAACGRANQIFVYHLPSGKAIGRLTDPQLLQGKIYTKPGVAHMDMVQALAFSPDGTLLASSEYRTVKLWRRPTNVRAMNVEAAAAQAAQSVAVSGDGKWMAVGASDGPIQLIDRTTGKAARTLTGHTGAVSALRFSADSTRLFSGSADKSVRIWLVADGASAGRIDTPGPVAALTLVGDGSLLATAGGDNYIRIWKTPTAVARALPDVPGPVTAMAASPDKKTLALAAADGSIRLVDVATGKVTSTLAGHTGPVTSLAFQAGAPRLISGSADRTLRIWDLATAKPVMTLAAPQSVDAVAINPAGTQAASGYADGGVSLWRLNAAADRNVGAPGAAPSTAFAVSNDGKLIATGGVSEGKPAVVVRDVATGKVTRTLVGHAGPIHALAFSNDATRLASGSDDKTVIVWNLADGAQLGKCALHADKITAVAFHPAGQQVVSASADFALKLWTVADGKEVKAFAGHTAAIVGVRMTAAGQVVSASADQTVCVWNPADGAVVRNIKVGTPVSALALSRDDTQIAVAGADNQLRTFQFADGAPVATLPGHTAAVRAIAYSADNKLLVSAGEDGAALLWDVPAKKLLEVLPAGAPQHVAGFTPTPGEVLLEIGPQLVARTPHFERALAGHTQGIRGLIYRNDGSLLYTASKDGSVRGFQPADGVQRFTANHGAPVQALAYSPNGQWLASAGDDKFVKIWNADNGGAGPKPQLGGFTGPVASVAFTKDSLHVIGGGGASPGEALVFNLATGEAEQAFGEHAATVTALATAGDPAELVVSAAGDKTVRLWPLAIEKLIAGHTQPVTALDTLTTPPVEIISGSQDGTMRQWNTTNGQMIRQFNHGGPIVAVGVRPDNQRLFSAGGNIARLWNSQTNQPIADLKGDLRAQSLVTAKERSVTAAKAMVVSLTARIPEAEKLAMAETAAVKKATDAKAAAEKVLTEKADLATKAMAEKTTADTAAAAATKAAADAVTAKTAADKALVDAQAAAKKATDAAAAAKVALDKEPNNAALVAAKTKADADVTAANQAVTTAQTAKNTADQTMAQTAQAAKQATDVATAKTKAFDEADAARKRADTVKTASTKALEAAGVAAKKAADAVPATKAELAAASASVTQLETELKTAQAAAAMAEMPLRAARFSLDGAQIATAGDDKLVHTWSSETGAALDTFSGHNAAVLGLAFAPDALLASVSADKTAALWSTTPEWKLERVIGGPDSPAFVDRVTALDFSADGKLLATGGGDPSRSGELKIWNVADGALAREIPDAHSDTIFGVQFSPDGKYIASCGADKFVKVFDLSTGKLARSFEGHTHHVLGVAWRFDGKQLASAGADSVVKIWDFDTGEQKLTIPGFTKEVTSVHFIGITTNTLSTSGDASVRMHNADNGQNFRNFTGGKDYIYSGAVTADGKLLIAGGQDSVLHVWNGENGQVLYKFEAPAAQPPVAQQAMK